MCKKMYKVIIFVKDIIPSSEKFKDELKNILEMQQKQNIVSSAGDISVPNNDIQDIILNMALNNMTFENKNYFLNGIGNRIELGTQESFSQENINLKDFEDKILKIIKFLENAFLDIIRVGYIYTFFEETKEPLNNRLNIPFLEDKQEIQLQFNKRIPVHGILFNDNISIYDNWKRKKGITIVQDFNSVPQNNLILDSLLIEEVFEWLKTEYYEQDILKKILK